MVCEFQMDDRGNTKALINRVESVLHSMWDVPNVEHKKKLKILENARLDNNQRNSYK